MLSIMETRLKAHQSIGLYPYRWINVQLESISGLVVRVPGHRPMGPGFDSRRYQISCVALGLERGPLRLVKYL
jgi:hypothetical protein